MFTIEELEGNAEGGSEGGAENICAVCIGLRYEKVSVTTLAFALKELMEDLFELFETDAVKVILYLNMLFVLFA